MNDLISRQAVLDAIASEPPDAHYPDWYISKIQKIPSEHVGNSDQLNRTCANCKHYTEEHLCVYWSYFGFNPNDYCSRWEEKE